MNSTAKQPSTSTSAKPPSQVVVALVQMTGDTAKSRNVKKALSRISEAAAAGANIVCLQELFAGQYPCQSEDHARFDEAEPIPGPTSEALAEAARKHGVVVVGSLFERRAPGLYHNTAVVFDADGRLCPSTRCATAFRCTGPRRLTNLPDSWVCGPGVWWSVRASARSGGETSGANAERDAVAGAAARESAGYGRAVPQR